MNYYNMPIESFYEESFRNLEHTQGGDSTSQEIIRAPEGFGLLEKKTIDPAREGGRAVIGGLGVTGGTLLAISGESVGYVIIALGVYIAGSGLWRLRKYL